MRSIFSVDFRTVSTVDKSTRWTPLTFDKDQQQNIANLCIFSRENYIFMEWKDRKTQYTHIFIDLIQFSPLKRWKQRKHRYELNNSLSLHSVVLHSPAAWISGKSVLNGEPALWRLPDKQWPFFGRVHKVHVRTYIDSTKSVSMGR